MGLRAFKKIINVIPSTGQKMLRKTCDIRFSKVEISKVKGSSYD